MRLNDYERKAQREIEKWHRGESHFLLQALDLAMKPFDWVVEQVIPEDFIDQVDAAIGQFLAYLSDASEWTYEEKDVLKRAEKLEVEADSIFALRDAPLETLDELARGHFDENAIIAAIEGGGTGLGGAIFIAADIPLLFTINFRLIQQIGASYGFSMRGPEFRPLVLSIYNVAASGTKKAKNDALREMTVAAASFAGDTDYRGRRVSGTFQEQNRHLPRELAKNLIGRKLAQMIPIAGAAVGAGVNYWFTTQTAETSFMLFRALYLERKERM